MPDSELKFPLFTLPTKDRSGAVYFKVEDDVFITLISDAENATLFAERCNLDVSIRLLEDTKTLRLFLTQPSMRSRKTREDLKILFDPISDDTGEYLVITKQQLFADLN